MAKALVGSTQNSGAVFSLSPGATVYAPLLQSLLTSAQTTEAFVKVKHKIAGTYMGIRVYVVANSFSTSVVTIRFRKNAGNGNQVFTISAGASGVFSDASNQDTVAVDDDVNASIVTASGGTGTIQIANITAVFSATSGHSIPIGLGSGGQIYSAASTTYYIPFCGNGSNIGVEATKQLKVGVIGSLFGFSTYVDTNTRGTTTTFKTRVNGADGSQIFTVSAAATGFFQDTTHTDTLSNATDLINATISTSTGTGSFTLRGLNVQFTSSDGAKNLNASAVGGGIARAASSTGTPYQIIGILATDSEIRVSLPFQFATVLSNMRVYVSANTYTVEGTMQIRKNGGYGNQTLTITALTTGAYEDTSNTDISNTTDLWNFEVIGGTTGSATFETMSMLSSPIAGRTMGIVIG